MRRILLLCPQEGTQKKIRSSKRRTDRKLQDITPLEVTYNAFVLSTFWKYDTSFLC